jgi:hypothetical protein
MRLRRDQYGRAGRVAIKRCRRAERDELSSSVWVLVTVCTDTRRFVYQLQAPWVDSANEPGLADFGRVHPPHIIGPPRTLEASSGGTSLLCPAVTHAGPRHMTLYAYSTRLHLLRKL